MPFKSHFIPRTRAGRIVTALVLLLYLLIQWPILKFVNRSEPFIMGMPFLYIYLLLVYLSIIVVMVYACRKGV